MLVAALLVQSNCDIVIFDDKSSEMFTIDEKYNERVKLITSNTHRGKAGFWQTYQDIFDYCKSHEYDYYIILPDDVEPSES